MGANTNHDSFAQPPDKNCLVWRYLDLAKYLDLLTSRTLFLSTVGCLPDHFEGSITHINDQATREYINSIVDMSPEVKDRALQNLSNSQKDSRSRININCWHMSEFESEAMWKLYGKHADAVAIRTRYSTLVNCLPESTSIGLVNYIDYKTDYIPGGNLLTPYMYKRMSFEHEKEVRVLYWQAPTLEIPLPLIKEDGGIRIPVYLDLLIEDIYVAPSCPKWQLRLIKLITTKFLPSKTVHQSSLQDPAIF